MQKYGDDRILCAAYYYVWFLGMALGLMLTLWHLQIFDDASRFFGAHLLG